MSPIRALLCRIFGHRRVIVYDPFTALLGASLNHPELIRVRVDCERCGAFFGEAEPDFSQLIAGNIDTLKRL